MFETRTHVGEYFYKFVTQSKKLPRGRIWLSVAVNCGLSTYEMNERPSLEACNGGQNLGNRTMSATLLRPLSRIIESLRIDDGCVIRIPMER